MMITWVKRVGVAVALAGGIVLLWRGIFIVAVAITLTAAGAYVRHVWLQWRAVSRFRAVWQPQGKDLLLVYSNSPHWKQYVEENWLPRWRQRAVVLNWSERGTWQRERGPEVALFRAFAGDREFNPLGIVVPPEGRRALVVRFWRPFRDYKHGRDRLLRAAEAELERRLGGTSNPIGR
jgi:hypothetical protein